MRNDAFLDNRHFTLTIVAALALHAAAIGAWQLMPKQQVVDIPVRPLNIKLGDGDAVTAEEIKAVQPNAANAADIEAAIAQLTREQSPDTRQRQQSVIDSMERAMDKSSKSAAPNALDEMIKKVTAENANFVKQYVREAGMPAPSLARDPAKDRDPLRDAELVARYEQLISAWIKKFKMYPDEARAQGLQGETVVRIHLDRYGNLRYYVLEKSTGNITLDRAAIEMIRRANPVPAVPVDYPPGDLFEFLIPVNFHLQ